MVTHSNKQIKEQLPTSLHLHLHSPTPLKRTPASNDQRQVMRPQLRVRIRCIGVCISRARQDRVALDTCMQPLFTECKALEGWKIIFLSGAAGFN